MGLARLHTFEAAVEAAWPAATWCNSHVVLAVSGGADSVAVLRAAVAIKQSRGGEGRLYVGHLNHGLRGAAAAADAAWLKGLCEKLDVPIEIGTSDVAALAESARDGWEAAARTARYEFLRRTAETIGARFVAVAHTADDQVETVLHRIVRGTGIAGLAGMRGSRPLSPSVALIRPMLGLRRADVREYLAAIGQDYRTDSTNVELRFTRNRLRHELLPALRERYNADLDAALLRLAAQAGESQRFIESVASQVVADCVMRDRCAGTVRVDCRGLASQPDLIIREVCKTAWSASGWPLQAMGFAEWQQLADLVRGCGRIAVINLPGNVQARLDGSLLVLQVIGLA